jgi:hypothetical protein
MPTFLLTLERTGGLTSDDFDTIPDIEDEIRRVVEPAAELRAIYWTQESDTWSPLALVSTPVLLRMAAVRSDLEVTGRFVLRDVLRLWEAPEFKHRHGEPA